MLQTILKNTIAFSCPHSVLAIVKARCGEENYTGHNLEVKSPARLMNYVTIEKSDL